MTQYGERIVTDLRIFLNNDNGNDNYNGWYLSLEKLLICQPENYWLLKEKKLYLTFWTLKLHLNRPRSIYQYSNIAARLSDQTSVFGVVFKFQIERQTKPENLPFWPRKPQSRAGILICRTCLLQNQGFGIHQRENNNNPIKPSRISRSLSSVLSRVSRSTKKKLLENFLLYC